VRAELGWIGRAAAVIAAATALGLGCSKSDEGAPSTGAGGASSAGGGGAGGGVDGAPVAADELCAKLAAIACAADDTCCDGKASVRSASGAGGAGPTQADEGCAERQYGACVATFGKLLGDPRTGYDPKAGGALVAKAEAIAKGCFAEPVPYEAFAAALPGTGAPGASCTPADTSAASLRLAAFSCAEGTACHLYLRADGTPEGVCEKRADDGCSHAFDCPATAWCDLAKDWKPGVWGTCRPLRATGWACASDLECASRVCGDDGTCAPTKGRDFCLTTLYATAVADDAPIAWWRLGEAGGATAKDASKGHHDATRAGDPEAEPSGALRLDVDGATRFDGDDDRVKAGALGLGSALGLSVEAWVRPRGDVSGTTWLAFGAAAAPGVAMGTTGALDAVTVDLVDGTGASHVITAKAPLAADAWHHVVATWDGAKGSLYVDGAAPATIDTTSTPRSAGGLVLGASADDHGWRGALDEVAIYDHALGPARVRAHRRIAGDGPIAPAWRPFAWFR
jgi:hypothetical protein